MQQLFSKLITTDLEKAQIVPNGAEEHFQIPEGQESVELPENEDFKKQYRVEVNSIYNQYKWQDGQA
ncbi:hypothetical protein Q3G72_026978 [Acer saccharum]|nr:hypothetical protein Q3G72_026978 [Acer saccharum]